MIRTFGQVRNQFGQAVPPRVISRPPATVTGTATGIVNLAARPIRWTFNTAGGLVHGVGSLLQTIARKL